MSLFSIAVALLTLVMVVACLFLILLVLVQLPKKDAGAGMAFGGGTADALFGAGSGNMLTKVTGWTAFILLALALILGKMQGASHAANNGSEFSRQLEQKQQMQQNTMQSQQPKSPTTPPANGLLSVPMQAPATNLPAPAPGVTATNPAK